MRRRHSPLVHGFQVNSLGQEIPAHLQVVLLDRIVNRPLLLHVRMVMLSPIADELLDGLDMTFSHSIIDRRLFIFIKGVDVNVFRAAEEIDDLGVTLSRCIEQSSLLELIKLGRVHALVYQHSDHVKSNLGVLDRVC